MTYFRREFDGVSWRKGVALGKDGSRYRQIRQNLVSENAVLRSDRHGSQRLTENSGSSARPGRPSSRQTCSSVWTVQEITAISKAIVDLPPVPREEVESVLREFHQSLVTGMDVVSGGEDAAKRLLMANLDGETAKYVMDSLELETGPVPFRELERVSPRMLAQLLRSEHPQTLALILGHLKPDQAATCCRCFPQGCGRKC